MHPVDAVVYAEGFRPQNMNALLEHLYSINRPEPELAIMSSFPRSVYSAVMIFIYRYYIERSQRHVLWQTESSEQR